MKVQFVLGADWPSRVIAWWGQGYGGWSHVDAVMDDGWLLGARDDVIDPPGLPVVKAGVQLRPPNYERWARRSVIDIPATPIEERRWLDFLQHQINFQYDSGAILAFITGRREPTAPGHWICSALQMGAARASGKAFATLIPDSQVTPNSLYLLFTAGLGGVVVSYS